MQLSHLKNTILHVRETLAQIQMYTIWISVDLNPLH